MKSARRWKQWRYKITIKSNWKYKYLSKHSDYELFALAISFIASYNCSTLVSLLPILLIETVLSFISFLPIAKIIGTFLEL